MNEGRREVKKTFWTSKNKTTEPQEQKPKQVKKSNYLFLYAFFTLGIMGTGYLLSPYGKVNEVYIEGNTMVPEQRILEASQITSKKTMIGTIWNEDEIAQSIKVHYPQIKNVDIQWRGVHHVLLEIEDYEVIAYIDHDNHYQTVLETGEVLLDDQTVPLGNKPLLQSFEAGPMLNRFITSFKEIDEEVQHSISEIRYTGTKDNPYTITLHMNDGNQVKANVNDFADKINYYPSILQELDGKKGTLDMEVGVYFTPFDNQKSED